MRNNRPIIFLCLGISVILTVWLIISADGAREKELDKRLAYQDGVPDGMVRLANGALMHWPPQVGYAYPDLQLYNSNGKLFRLSDHRGKVVIIEPIGMSCPACNAFAGAGEGGVIANGFGGTVPQPGVLSFEASVKRNGKGVSLDDPNLLYIHLLLFNLRMQAPTVEDARLWSQHFKLNGRPNHVVLAGDPALLLPKHYPATYKMIPGFQLLSRNLALEVDSSGHAPKHNLYTRLIPRIKRFLDAPLTSSSVKK